MNITQTQPTERSQPIPLCTPELRGNEWRYIKECLDTGWVSTVGAFVERFERAVAEAVGTRFAVATNSGTAALHLALLVAGIKANDEVLVPTLTFIAPANAIRYVGAWPVFVDAEPRFWQLDVERIADFLAHGCNYHHGALYNRATGRRVRAILPVHILGHPVDMAPLLELARRYDLPVIEDATESLGASYREQPVGSLGDAACFSFNGNKLLTTGGGGMFVTDNEAWARRAKHLSTQAKDDPLEYIHSEIGYNYRLTNIQAALGVAQIEHLAEYLAAKRAIAARYQQALAESFTVMPQARWANSAFWMYTLLAKKQGGSRALMRVLAEHQIQTRPLWQPLHTSKAHIGSYALGGDVAEQLNRDALSLPCSVGLSHDDQDWVIECLLSWANSTEPKQD